jgi:hypothetical protein
MKKFFAAFTFANITKFALWCVQMVFEVLVLMGVTAVAEGVATWIVALMLAPFGLSQLAGLIVFLVFFTKGIYRKLRAWAREYIIEPVYAFFRNPRLFFATAFA